MRRTENNAPYLILSGDEKGPARKTLDGIADPRLVDGRLFAISQISHLRRQAVHSGGSVLVTPIRVGDTTVDLDRFGDLSGRFEGSRQKVLDIE